MHSVTVTSQKARNSSLDVLKGIAAIFVVFIHALFPGQFGKLICDIGSFAVPVFFMVSGYFSFGASREKFKKSIVHILQLIGIAYALNVIRIFIGYGCQLADTISYFKDQIFTVKHIVLWLLFNGTYVVGVAWFLFALLYCYLFCYLFHKFYQSKYAYVIIILGFLGGIVCEIFLPVIGIDGMRARNFWFCGIPYFLCGKLIHEKGEKWMLKPHNMLICILSAVLGLAIIIVGSLSYYGIIYVGTILLSTALFYICVKYPDLKNKALQQLGNKYAFFVYIGHSIVIFFFDGLFGQIGGVLAWLRPLIVLAITVICAWMYYTFKGWVSNARFEKSKQNSVG